MRADPVAVRFRRAGEKAWKVIDVFVDEPIDVLNIANRHFGDPLKNIGGPRLPHHRRMGERE